MTYKWTANQSGVLILIALITTTLVLTSALIISTIVIRQLRLSQSSDNGILAYFASESVTEDAMYAVLRQGTDPEDLPVKGAFPNGTSWERNVREKDSRFVYDLIQKDKFVVLDLYNNDNSNSAAGVESLSFVWSSGGRMDVLLRLWNGDTLKEADTVSFICSSAPCQTVVLNSLEAGLAYELTITATSATITDLIVTTHQSDGATGSEILVDSSLTINSIGEYKGVKQAVQLRLPNQPPWELTVPSLEVVYCENYDLDEDSDVDQDDLNAMTDVLNGLVTCPIARCDLNFDGPVDILDAQIVDRFIAGTDTTCITGA